MNVIDSQLKKASDAAKQGYDQVYQYHNFIERSFDDFERNMLELEESLLNIGTEHESLVESLNDLINTRRKGIKSCWETWEKLFEKRRSDLDYFSIMLFGRTMAGKSTTLEALVGGDGTRIGNGTPDHTKDLDFVSSDLIRIVDTPGIEGFAEETFEVAETFMDRADIITFVIGDDHIEPSLLEHLVSILNRRKPLIILLNIKVGNINRLLRNPDRAFRKEEIDGHKRRILNFLKDSLKKNRVFIDPNNVSIIPVCSQAANIARNEDSLDSESRTRLHELSNIDTYINAYKEIIINKSVTLRSNSSYESFSTNLQEIEDGLKIELYRINQQRQLLEKNISKCAHMFTDLIKLGDSEIKSFREHFNLIDQQLDSLVDKCIKNKIEDPSEHFLYIVGLEEIKRKIDLFCIEHNKEIVDRINKFQRNLNIDFNIANNMTFQNLSLGINIELNDVNWANFKTVMGKWGKIVGSPAIGFGAGILAGVAVTNFWNPAGWIAAAASVVVGAGAGIASSHLFDKLKTEGKDDLSKLRSSLKKQFQKELNKICEEDIVQPLESWVLNINKEAESKLESGLNLLNNQIKGLVHTGGSFIQSLIQTRGMAATASIDSLLKLLVENHKSINIYSVARRVGYRTNIALTGKNAKNNKKMILGENNSVIKELTNILEGENITIVAFDEKNITEKDLKDLLHPANLENCYFQFERNKGKNGHNKFTIKIHNIPDDEIKKAYGPHKWNLRLAEELFSAKIILKGVNNEYFHRKKNKVRKNKRTSYKR